jgi:hypothetical protein
MRSLSLKNTAEIPDENQVKTAIIACFEAHIGPVYDGWSLNEAYFNHISALVDQVITQGVLPSSISVDPDRFLIEEILVNLALLEGEAENIDVEEENGELGDTLEEMPKVIDFQERISGRKAKEKSKEKSGVMGTLINLRDYFAKKSRALVWTAAAGATLAVGAKVVSDRVETNSKPGVIKLSPRLDSRIDVDMNKAVLPQYYEATPALAGFLKHQIQVAADQLDVSDPRLAKTKKVMEAFDVFGYYFNLGTMFADQPDVLVKVMRTEVPRFAFKDFIRLEGIALGDLSLIVLDVDANDLNKTMIHELNHIVLQDHGHNQPVVLLEGTTEHYTRQIDHTAEVGSYEKITFRAFLLDLLFDEQLAHAYALDMRPELEKALDKFIDADDFLAAKKVLTPMLKKLSAEYLLRVINQLPNNVTNAKFVSLLVMMALNEGTMDLTYADNIFKNHILEFWDQLPRDLLLAYKEVHEQMKKKGKVSNLPPYVAQYLEPLTEEEKKSHKESLDEAANLNFEEADSKLDNFLSRVLPSMLMILLMLFVADLIGKRHNRKVVEHESRLKALMSKTELFVLERLQADSNFKAAFAAVMKGGAVSISGNAESIDLGTQVANLKAIFQDYFKKGTGMNGKNFTERNSSLMSTMLGPVPLGLLGGGFLVSKGGLSVESGFLIAVYAFYQYFLVKKTIDFGGRRKQELAPFDNLTEMLGTDLEELEAVNLEAERSHSRPVLFDYLERDPEAPDIQNAMNLRYRDGGAYFVIQAEMGDGCFEQFAFSKDLLSVAELIEIEGERVRMWSPAGPDIRESLKVDLECGRGEFFANFLELPNGLCVANTSSYGDANGEPITYRHRGIVLAPGPLYSGVIPARYFDRTRFTCTGVDINKLEFTFFDKLKQKIFLVRDFVDRDTGVRKVTNEEDKFISTALYEHGYRRLDCRDISRFPNGLILARYSNLGSEKEDYWIVIPPATYTGNLDPKYFDPSNYEIVAFDAGRAEFVIKDRKTGEKERVTDAKLYEEVDEVLPKVMVDAKGKVLPVFQTIPLKEMGEIEFINEGSLADKCREDYLQSCEGKRKEVSVASRGLAYGYDSSFRWKCSKSYIRLPEGVYPTSHVFKFGNLLLMPYLQEGETRYAVGIDGFRNFDDLNEQMRYLENDSLHCLGVEEITHEGIVRLKMKTEGATPIYYPSVYSNRMDIEATFKLVPVGQGKYGRDSSLRNRGGWCMFDRPESWYRVGKPDVCNFDNGRQVRFGMCGGPLPNWVNKDNDDVVGDDDIVFGDCEAMEGGDLMTSEIFIQLLCDEVGLKVKKIKMPYERKLPIFATRADIVSAFRDLRADYTRAELWNLAEAVIRDSKVEGNGVLRNSRNQLSSDGDFRDLRSYEVGDGLKMIDWKATARTGKVGLDGIRVKTYEDKAKLAPRALVVSMNSLIGSMSFSHLFSSLVHAVVKRRKDPINELFLVDDDGVTYKHFSLENLNMGDLFTFFENICDLVEEYYLSSDNRLGSLDIYEIEQKIDGEDVQTIANRHEIRYRCANCQDLRLPERIKKNAVLIGYNRSSVSSLSKRKVHFK